jgi:pilus assembly protein TadC
MRRDQHVGEFVERAPGWSPVRLGLSGILPPYIECGPAEVAIFERGVKRILVGDAGLSLDQAIEQVAQDLSSSSPEVAGEFAAAAAEMRVLPDRSKALENLAQRAGLASLRSIVATLNQSIRFGTPLSDSLRVLAAEMRTERLARYEERAARLPVLLALPLMGFILPSMMIVVGTPLILRMVDFLQQSIAGNSGVGGKLIGVP